MSKSTEDQEKKKRLKEMLEDPVCGLCLYPDDTAGQSLYDEDLFYFCSIKCKEEFDKYPDKYGKKQKSNHLNKKID